MPHFEQMVNAFALDQCPGKNGAEFFWSPARLETIHIHAAREIK